MSPTPEIEDFSSLCSEYLNMLSQDSVDPLMVTDTRTTPQPPASNDQEVVQAIMDVLMQGGGDFLTSPMESPFDDFLPTPGQKHDDFGADFTSPLIVDDGGATFDSPLFHDSGLFEPASNKIPSNDPFFRSFSNSQMYTISPATPALEPSHIMRPNPAPSLSRPSNVPNGTRKNVTPESLVPLDAPVQPRKYLTSSVTSRKDEPARKRARSQAFDDDEDEQQEGSSKGTELDSITAKRLQNTLAARRSRKRKLEYQRELETALDQVRAEKEQWRARAMTLEALLTSHGITVPTNF
jgi:hypothetical protein